MRHLLDRIAGLRVRVVAVAITLSAGASAHANDFRLEFPPLLTMSPTGVNLQTGRLELNEPGFQIGPFDLSYRWSSIWTNEVFSFPTSAPARQNINSLNPANGIGRSLRGWLEWTTRPTYEGSQTVIIVHVNDVDIEFNVSGTNADLLSRRSAASFGWSLVRDGSVYRATSKSGDVYTFVDHSALPNRGYPQKDKVLSHVVYADGHRLDYSYGSTANLLRIASNRGYALLLDYNAGSQTVTACGYNASVDLVDGSTTCASAAIKATYAFSSVSGRLQMTSYTDVEGYPVSLSYTNHLVNCVTLPASSTCRIQNSYGDQPGELGGHTAVDQVRKQITATNDNWLYHYTNPPQHDDTPPQLPGEIRYTHSTMTDPMARLTMLTYANGFLYRVIPPDGTSINDGIIYGWSGLQPSQIVFREGNKLDFAVGLAGNVGSKTATPKSGSPLTATQVTLGYPIDNYNPTDPVCVAAGAALCDKPLLKTDERGNQTDYAWDATHGGILSETGPAVNGIRPQTRYTYSQRYAWIRASGGGYTPATSPVWVLVQKSSCKAGAASGSGCALAGDEVRTDYDYGPNSGPNNLLLRGTVEDATGLALRTCYGYDAQGNRVSETKPRAGLGACP